MGCGRSRMRANPRVSRALMRVTPSRLPGIPTTDLDVMRAVVQSTCITCELKHRPEVYAFLDQDLPLYHNLTLEDGGDQETILLLLNHDDKILKSIPLWDKSRAECNSILEDWGFYRKEGFGAPVPEQFQYGPYRPRRGSLLD